MKSDDALDLRTVFVTQNSLMIWTMLILVQNNSSTLNITNLQTDTNII